MICWMLRECVCAGKEISGGFDVRSLILKGLTCFPILVILIPCHYLLWQAWQVDSNDRISPRILSLEGIGQWLHGTVILLTSFIYDSEREPLPRLIRPYLNVKRWQQNININVKLMKMRLKWNKSGSKATRRYVRPSISSERNNFS